MALGSGQDYLQFGLLYNFHYTTNWSLPFTSDFLNFFFTLPGKFIVTTTLILVITGLRKKIKPAAQLIMTWAALALMAALLSNRPYPHYFQQVIPALVLLFGLLVGNLKKVITEKTISLKSHLATFLMSLTIFALTIGALFSLNFYTYPALSYYQNFYRLITGQMSLADYRQSFDDHMTDNYQAAEIIKESGVDEIFIWGTNPMLYALSQTQPTGRFTVAFHIEDLGVYEETMASVKAKEPLFIVVMKNQQQPLEGLEEYLDEYYILNSNFENFWFWKRFK